MHSTGDILQYWADFMAAQDLTVRTIEERVRFIYHVETNAGPILTLTRYDLIRYLGLDPAWSNTTKQHYRSALHTFFTWLQDEGFRPDNPGAKLPKVKVRKRTPTPFSKEEIELVLNSGAYRRTRMMIALHYYLGLRVSEIARVHGGRDISWTNRTLTTVGKGEKTVTLPLSDAMWEIAKGMPRDAYWFPNWKANRLYAAGEGHILGNSVSTIIGNAIRRAGIVGHRPHDLRAATATLQSRAGADPFIVQKNMRHESMDTTTKYRLVDLEEQREGFEALPVVIIPERAARRRRATAAEEPQIAA